MSEAPRKNAGRSHRRHSLLTLVLMGLLFAAMAWESTTRPTPEDTEPFHARVRAAVEGLPTKIGDWEGRDIPTSKEVVRLLNPNVVYQKRFTHGRTGEVVHVLLVHCRDARDIYGHYPPRCYPAQGHEQVSSKSTTSSPRIARRRGHRTGHGHRPAARVGIPEPLPRGRAVSGRFSGSENRSGAAPDHCRTDDRTALASDRNDPGRWLVFRCKG